MNRVQRLRVAVAGLLAAVALLLAVHIWDAARLAGLEGSLRSIVLEKQAAADRAERCGRELRDLRRAQQEHEVLDEQREALWLFSVVRAAVYRKRLAAYERLHPDLKARSRAVVRPERLPDEVFRAWDRPQGYPYVD
jgi:hypothetical protein